ncbi:hypothetical protein KY366_03890 [Candidatus Woesearchaeota archaeon]|nr:hypothetical protein [Candidatus Woesearchaeota archaeon]
MPLKDFLKRNKSLFLVFILFLVIISVMQFRVNEIIGFDGWLHINMAGRIKDEGFIKEFPYITESILSGNYADLQFLFRLLLIPFTSLGLIPGAKIASSLFAALCFTFFYWYLEKSGINYPLFWTSLYAVSSVDLMYRFLLPRAMPLAVLSLLLTFYFIDKRMYKSLLVTSFLFVWLYPGFVFQLAAIAVYFTIDALISRKIDLKLLAYPAIGVLAALIFNPYFPNNISLLYTQLFKVNLIGNLYNTEWKPWNLKEFFRFNYLLFSLFILSLYITFKKMKLDKRSLFFLALSLISLIAMLKTRRMHEYFAPFTVLFAAFSSNKALTCLKSHKKTALRYISIISVLFLLIIAVLGLIGLDKHIKNNHFLPWYKDGAEWIRYNLPENSVVFINGYTFNYLFFYAPNLRYTHGIDLTYSYLYDASKFERYMGVLQGIDPGYNIIKEDYNADYAVVGKVKQDIKLFDYIVRYKEDFEVLYEDQSIGILEVRK